MNDLLTHLVTQLTGHSNFTIEEFEEDDAQVYTIFLEESDYPTIIGKRGLTIKAITALCRIKQRTTPTIGSGRFYIKVESRA